MGKPTHRMSRSPEYKVWRNMIGRCEYPRHDHYPSYGGRGIRVCPEWRGSFEAFFAAVGPRPSRGHTIDRIDVNGDYLPGNVRWATDGEQRSNRQDSQLVTVGDVTLTVAEWARKAGLNRFTIYKRITKLGWAPAKAVATPRGPQHGRTEG